MKWEYTGRFFRVVIEFFSSKLEIKKYSVRRVQRDSMAFRRRVLQDVTLDLKKYVADSDHE